MWDPSRPPRDASARRETPPTSGAVRRARRARRNARLDRLAVLLLAVTSALLWYVAVPQLHATLTHFGASQTVPARVAGCAADGVLTSACRVTYLDRGRPVTRLLNHPGLLGVEPGDEVEVFLAPDGTAAAGGWRPYADSGVFLLLALAVSSYTLRRWSRVEPMGGTRGAGHGGGEDFGGSGSAGAGPLGPLVSRRGRRSRAHPAA